MVKHTQTIRRQQPISVFHHVVLLAIKGLKKSGWISQFVHGGPSRKTFPVDLKTRTHWIQKQEKCISALEHALISCSINLFSTNILLLYLLKVSENLRFSDVFRGNRSGTLVENRLMEQEIRACSNAEMHFSCFWIQWVRVFNLRHWI